MSIADKLDRLSTARNNIISSLTSRGVVATGHGFEDFPQDIMDITLPLESLQVQSNGIYIPTLPVVGYSSAEISVKPGLLTPYYVDLGPNQYVYTGGKFQLNGTTVNYSDVYILEPDTKYILLLGPTVSTRFRSIMTAEDTTTTKVPLTGGTQVVYKSDPLPYDHAIFTSTSNQPYLTITKSNDGTANIPTYVFKVADLISGIS